MVKTVLLAPVEIDTMQTPPKDALATTRAAHELRTQLLSYADAVVRYLELQDPIARFLRDVGKLGPRTVAYSDRHTPAEEKIIRKEVDDESRAVRAFWTAFVGRLATSGAIERYAVLAADDTSEAYRDRLDAMAEQAVYAIVNTGDSLDSLIDELNGNIPNDPHATESGQRADRLKAAFVTAAGHEIITALADITASHIHTLIDSRSEYDDIIDRAAEESMRAIRSNTHTFYELIGQMNALDWDDEQDKDVANETETRFFDAAHDDIIAALTPVFRRHMHNLAINRGAKGGN